MLKDTGQLLWRLEQAIDHVDQALANLDSTLAWLQMIHDTKQRSMTGEMQAIEQLQTNIAGTRQILIDQLPDRQTA